MIAAQELKILNSRGLIVGPDEDEAQFLERIEIFNQPCIEQKKALLPQESAFFLASADLHIDWVSVEYSKKGLHFWEAAATWIHEASYKDKNKIFKPIHIQLHPKLEQGKLKLFCFTYKREEILAHEWVHAARAAFRESRFEEILAYSVAKNLLRKSIGPFFQSERESIGFVCIVFAGLLIQAIGVFLDIFIPLMVSFFISFFAVFLGTVRLIYNQIQFRRAKKNLEKMLDGNELAFLLRLTDSEIKLFSQSTQEEIKSYISKQSSLRWKQIVASYLGTN